MRYYEQRYPEVDELVMVQVRQIAEMGGLCQACLSFFSLVLLSPLFHVAYPESIFLFSIFSHFECSRLAQNTRNLQIDLYCMDSWSTTTSRE